jgi:competence ComEA-like helix-hairpin-helix protein
MKKVVGLGVLLLSGAAFAHQDSLPEGEGRPAVEKACTSRCHGANVVQRSRRTPTQWQGIVDLMIDRGAVVKDEDYDAILAYLGKQLLATVNINAAPVDRIVEVLEVSRKEAAAIVGYRDKHGPFKGWEGVARVPGIDGKAIEERRERLEFE